VPSLNCRATGATVSQAHQRLRSGRLTLRKGRRSLDSPVMLSNPEIGARCSSVRFTVKYHCSRSSSMSASAAESARPRTARRRHHRAGGNRGGAAALDDYRFPRPWRLRSPAWLDRHLWSERWVEPTNRKCGPNDRRLTTLVGAESEDRDDHASAEPVGAGEPARNSADLGATPRTPARRDRTASLRPPERPMRLPLAAGDGGVRPSRVAMRLGCEPHAFVLTSAPAALPLPPQLCMPGRLRKSRRLGAGRVSVPARARKSAQGVDSTTYLRPSTATPTRRSIVLHRAGRHRSVHSS